MLNSQLLHVKKISEKVLVTGDGGDEIFTGYDRYKSIHIIQTLQKFKLILYFLRFFFFFKKFPTNEIFLNLIIFIRLFLQTLQYTILLIQKIFDLFFSYFC